MALIYFVAKRGQDGSKHIAFEKYMTENYEEPMTSADNKKQPLQQQQQNAFSPKDGDSAFVSMNNLMTMPSSNGFVNDNSVLDQNRGNGGRGD